METVETNGEWPNGKTPLDSSDGGSNQPTARARTDYRVRLTRDHEDVQAGPVQRSGPPGLAWTDLFDWVVKQGKLKVEAEAEISRRWGVKRLTQTQDRLGHLLVVSAVEFLLARTPRATLSALTTHYLFPSLDAEGAGLRQLFLDASADLLNEIEREPALVMSPTVALAVRDAFNKALMAVRDGKPRDAQRCIKRASDVFAQAAATGRFRKTGASAKGRARAPWSLGELRPWIYRAPGFEHLCALEFWFAVEQNIRYRLCSWKECYRAFAVQRGNFRYCPQCRSERRTTPEPSSGDKRIRKLLARNPRIGRRRAVSIVRAFHRLEVTKARRSLAPAEQGQFAKLHRQIYEV